MGPAPNMASSAPEHAVLVDVNNVRGRMFFPVLTDFCAACWRWAQAKEGSGLLFLAIDYGQSDAVVHINERLAVGFAGPRLDADTNIAREVDRLLAGSPAVRVTVITDDVQLKVRCRRMLPELPEEDPWYAAHGLQDPGVRTQLEWLRGAPRPASHLERLTFVNSDTYAAELELDESPWRRSTTQEAKGHAGKESVLLALWTWCGWLFRLLEALFGARTSRSFRKATWCQTDPPFVTGPPAETFGTAVVRARGSGRRKGNGKRTRRNPTLELYGPECSQDRQDAAAALQDLLTARYSKDHELE